MNPWLCWFYHYGVGGILFVFSIILALRTGALRLNHLPERRLLIALVMGLAGFKDIDVQVITRPDTDGRLLQMIKNMAGYARSSGKMSDSDVDEILSTIEQAVSDGSYLALAPQFVVTATR